MKGKVSKLTGWIFMIIGASSMSVSAQFDDMFSSPSSVEEVTYSEWTTPPAVADNSDYAAYDPVPSNRSDYNYDQQLGEDGGNAYYDEYEYTNRIRRFRNPNFNYDPYWDDPFFANRGTNVVVNVGGGWGWNNWNAGWGWNRPWGWNSWNAGWGYDPFWDWHRPWGWNNWNAGWGWNRPWGWNSWNAGWGWNRWNRWGWNSWDPWCPGGFGGGPVFVNNNFNNLNNVSNNPKGTVYGARRTQGSDAPSTGRRGDRVKGDLPTSGETEVRGSTSRDGSRATTGRGSSGRRNDGREVGGSITPNTPSSNGTSTPSRIYQRGNQGSDSGSTTRGSSDRPSRPSATRGSDNNRRDYTPSRSSSPRQSASPSRSSSPRSSGSYRGGSSGSSRSGGSVSPSRSSSRSSGGSSGRSGRRGGG